MQEPHRVTTTLSVASTLKSVRLSKFVAILTAERAGSYVRLDEMVTGKVRKDDLLYYRPKL